MSHISSLCIFSCSTQLNALPLKDLPSAMMISLATCASRPRIHCCNTERGVKNSQTSPCCTAQHEDSAPCLYRTPRFITHVQAVLTGLVRDAVQGDVQLYLSFKHSMQQSDSSDCSATTLSPAGAVVRGTKWLKTNHHHEAQRVCFGSIALL